MKWANIKWPAYMLRNTREKIPISQKNHILPKTDYFTFSINGLDNRLDEIARHY